MFSTIVYSVLLAFALSDIGGGGLAVEVEKVEPRGNVKVECDASIMACRSGEIAKDCGEAKGIMTCIKELLAKQPPCKQYWDQSVGDANYAFIKIPSEQCDCCDSEFYNWVIAEGNPKGKIYIDGGQCGPPPKRADVCMKCDVKLEEVSATFKGADTCDKLTNALNTAKTKGPGKCSEDELKKFLAPQKFVIKDLADCHKQECIDLGEQLKSNYSLALKVQNGSTEATECHDEGSAAFRMGSAIAPLLGALGIVLITFKIL